MELSKDEIEQMLARQADRVSQESEEMMKKHVSGLKEEILSETERYMGSIKEEILSETERYMGSLKEDFDSKIQIVLEQTSVIPQMQQTLNATFEEVGKLRIDVEAIKEVVKDHEVRIQKIEVSS